MAVWQKLSALCLCVVGFVSMAESVFNYRPGLARQLSQQGKVVSIVPHVREGASEWERSECAKEIVSEGTVRQYLAVADDVEVDAHDYASYPCLFTITIQFEKVEWTLDLNISGLGYLRTGETQWHALGCGMACSKFLPNAESESELCISAEAGC